MRRFWPILFLLVSACATLHQAPTTVPAGKALVYVYRRAIPFGPAEMHVYDGQQDKGVLTNGSYLDFMADPGPRAFKVVAGDSRSMPYATTLDGGHTYYFLAYFLGEQSKGDAALTPMDADTAKVQMANLKPIDQPD